MEENDLNKLKKPLKGWQLLLIADAAYLIQLLMGGIFFVFGLAGFTFLLFAIITGIRNVVKNKKKSNFTSTDLVMTIIGTIALVIIVSAIGSQN